jgi:cytochrome P450
VLSNAALLLIAGHETTVNLITNGTLTLLRHPEILDRLRRGDERDLTARVIEELLRYEPPVQFLSNRNTLDDIEVAGTTIPKGSQLTLALAAGSRDPAHVTDPDRFDPDRVHNEHLGFGGGIHYCFGAPLARPETQIALTELARRLKNPRLVADPPPYRTNPVLRGPRHLLIEIDGVNPSQHRQL